MPRTKRPPEHRERAHFVVSQYGGIVPQFEAFYIHSIIYSASASDDAFERFAQLVLTDLDNDAAIVSAIQEALTHAAGLSRFFWPVGNDPLAVARATRLRAAFEMDGSPLEDRELRNTLEHFDERLDEFLLADPTGFFFPTPLVRSHELADEAPGQMFRLVDPLECVFVILGQKHRFSDARREVERILKMANEFDRSGSRLPPPPSLLT